MGLGKTIQVLSLLDHDLRIRQSGENKENEDYEDDNEKPTTLVLCPLPLIQQWKTEIQRKFLKNTWSILVYHGKVKSVVEEIDEDIVLTTYETLASEFKV